MRFAVIGAGATGARVARQLASTDLVERIWVDDVRLDLVRAVRASLGTIARDGRGRVFDRDDIDVAILATPSGTHGPMASRLVEHGVSVVSISDAPEDVDALLTLDLDRHPEVTVVAGAGFAPGLTCVLARHASDAFDAVDEVHVAKSGTGGPACARQHHRALSSSAVDWRDGQWVRRPGGSGRQLWWFPDPVGAQDCYRAALADSTLLQAAFPNADRITARVAATRRDRFTSRLPMLRRPHPEGLVGAVRVEVWGRRGAAREGIVYGAIDRPAVAAGAVAALAAVWVASGSVERAGVGGLASLVAPLPFLTDLERRGIRAAVFEGDDG